MSTSEIVGAFIDELDVTTDMREINTARLCGLKVLYVSRANAFSQAVRTGKQTWQDLAAAPTLFILEAGSRFMPC